MSIREVKGNIFSTEAQTIVNTVNCVGVMGAGIALECRLRYPKMFQKYAEFCEQGLLKPGKLWLYKDQSPWVLNFPTKDHWRYPSKELYLRVGLINFVETYKKRGITSVAFPLLGADKGGIDKDVSKSIMKEYLSGLDIDIEIYEYDPNATDPLYLEIQEWILSANLASLSEKTGVNLKYLILINDSMMRKEIHQVGQILSIKGIGTHSVEKLLDYKFNQPQNLQISLF